MVVGTAEDMVNAPLSAEVWESLRGKLWAAVRFEDDWDAFVRHPLLEKVDDVRWGCRATGGANGGPTGVAVCVD